MPLTYREFSAPFYISAIVGGFIAIYQPDSTKHQVIGDTAPIHFASIVRGSAAFPAFTTGIKPMTGQVNVCYCDGSVRSITVTQLQFNGTASYDTPFVGVSNDATGTSKGYTVTSGGVGYTVTGGVGYWDGSRLDPNRTP